MTSFYSCHTIVKLSCLLPLLPVCVLGAVDCIVALFAACVAATGAASGAAFAAAIVAASVGTIVVCC